MDVETFKPYKVEAKSLTFSGNWSAEQIDNGEAGEPVETVQSVHWYQPTPNGPVEITDAKRIAELESQIQE